jgi:hypothetical protein
MTLEEILVKRYNAEKFVTNDPENWPVTVSDLSGQDIASVWIDGDPWLISITRTEGLVFPS